MILELLPYFARLPELQDELQKLIQKTEQGLRQLPKAPSQDAFTEIIHLLADFSRELITCLEGTPDVDGLLQQIRPHEVTFKLAIRSTAPDFRATVAPRSTMRLNAASESLAGDSDDEGDGPLGFLANEEDKSTMVLSDRRPIYIDEVMKRANQ